MPFRPQKSRLSRSLTSGTWALMAVAALAGGATPIAVASTLAASSARGPAPVVAEPLNGATPAVAQSARPIIPSPSGNLSVVVPLTNTRKVLVLLCVELLRGWPPRAAASTTDTASMNGLIEETGGKVASAKAWCRHYLSLPGGQATT